MKKTLNKFNLIFSACLLINMICWGQTKIDTNQIKGDINFSCFNNSEMDWDAGLFGVENICLTENKIEIRLNAYYLPNGLSELIILSFNNDKWNAKKYKYRKASIGTTLEFTTITDQTENKETGQSIFKLIYDSLKTSNIFLLPDQKSLKIENTIHDGVNYRLTYKVYNNYRCYHFNNPKLYSEGYPKIKELKQYETIVKYLNSIWN